MIAIFTGFIGGLIHVLSGPDHLAAVAPLAVEGRARAWRTGLRWGLGHSSGVVMVGVLSLWLREVLPVNFLSSWSEHLVGIVLIGIGIWGFRRAFSNHVHAHEHSHDGHHHLHVHIHGGQAAHNHSESATHTHTHAAFAVGTLHGVAGSSHFLGVLPALAFPTKAGAIVYLAAYGVGTVLAMLSFSSIVGLAANRFAVDGARIHRSLMLACSVTAMLVGGYWLMA